MQKLVSFYRSDHMGSNPKPRIIKSATEQKEHLNEYLENGWTVTDMAPFGCSVGVACSIKNKDYPNELLGHDEHTGGFLAVLLEDTVRNIRNKIVTIHRADWTPDVGTEQIEHLSDYFEQGWRAIKMSALGDGSGQDATGGEIQGFLVVLLEKSD